MMPGGQHSAEVCAAIRAGSLASLRSTTARARHRRVVQVLARHGRAGLLTPAFRGRAILDFAGEILRGNPALLSTAERHALELTVHRYRGCHTMEMFALRNPDVIERWVDEACHAS